MIKELADQMILCLKMGRLEAGLGVKTVGQQLKDLGQLDSAPHDWISSKWITKRQVCSFYQLGTG